MVYRVSCGYPLLSGSQTRYQAVKIVVGTLRYAVSDFPSEEASTEGEIELQEVGTLRYAVSDFPVRSHYAPLPSKNCVLNLKHLRLIEQ